MDTSNGIDVEKMASSSVFHRHLVHEPVIVERATGNYLYLKNGQRILDACGGAAVCSVGHAHPRIVAALSNQLGKLSYIHSGAFANESAEELARVLCKSSGMERAVFYNGGTEALDCSLKLVRQYHVENGQPERVNFIGRYRSYHGNSLTTLALANHPARRKPYEDILPSNFHHVSPAYAYRYQNSRESTEEYVQRLATELEDKINELGPRTVAAFYTEPVVGATTGCVPAPPGYLQAIKRICEKYGVLWCADEIMCGIGRTGKMHAWQWDDAQPDIHVVGKGLGGGYVPVSAVLISSKVVNVFKNGSGAFNNGHTYQSHVIGCSAALEILKVFEEENLVQKCHDNGSKLERMLHAQLDDHPNVGDIRGRGLFQGIEFVRDKASKECFPVSFPLADNLTHECLQRGLSIYPGGKGTFDGVNGDHVLIAPPYVITDDELNFITKTLRQALDTVLQEWNEGCGPAARTKASH